MINLTDTHAHLYWESFKDDFDDIVKRFQDAGVKNIVNVGVDVKLSKLAADQVKDILSKIPDLKSFSTIGIHPHEAIKYQDPAVLDQDINELEKIYQNYPGQIVAVGECGLDFFFDNNPDHNPTTLSENEQKKLQINLFKSQIDLAKKLNLPLIVHVRDNRSKDSQNSQCWDKTLELIGHSPTILHCYSGLERTTQQVLNLPNAFVSFAATITYPKNEYLRAAAKILPLEKIVLETDCPFLPPQSKRGQRNEPSNILGTAKLISEIKNLSLEEVSNQTSQNALKLFAKFG